MKTKMNKTRTKAPKQRTNIGDRDISRVKTKGQARQIAIEWQQKASEQSLSYGELIYHQEYLYKIAKKFGLVKEFKENGII